MDTDPGAYQAPVLQHTHTVFFFFLRNYFQDPADKDHFTPYLRPPKL